MHSMCLKKWLSDDFFEFLQLLHLTLLTCVELLDLHGVGKHHGLS